MTEKLFYEDVYLKEFDAKVVSCVKADNGFDVVLDKTAFFPTGGGQPCDLGGIDGKNVIDVSEKDGIIHHITDGELAVGCTVHGKIDWDRRFMLMQNHSGEHLLSGIVHYRHGLNNVGYHMGTDFITVDFDGILTDEQIESAEAAVNEIIAKNIEILIKYPSEEELKMLEYRSKKELTGQIRIVETPGIDVCACCGTHVVKTGEIELMKVVSHMKYKSGVRLFILSGKRAFEDYKRKNNDIYKLSAMLSRKPEEVTDGVSQVICELDSLKFAFDGLKRKYFTEITKNLPEKSGILCLCEDGCVGDDLLHLA